MQKFLKIIIGSIVVIIVLGAAFAYENIPRYSDTDPAYNRAYWEQLIRAKGGEEAYSIFLKKNEQAPASRQHLAIHAFGDMLYTVSGDEALQICTSAFGFGCYHGFFGQAIAARGVEAIPTFLELCNTYGSLATGCKHGVGHGIAEYLGQDRIDSALALCPKPHGLETFSECWSGVFMDYNFPFIGENSLPTTRPYDSAAPHEPCDRVEPQYADVCYFMLGQWVGTAPFPTSICTGLPNRERTFCELGIESETASSPAESVSVIRGLCTLLPPEEQGNCPPPYDPSER